jgi:recombination protein RecT
MTTPTTTAPSSQTPQQAIKQFFNSQSVKAKFEELLGKRSSAFVTSVLQIVNSNQLLQQCDPATVFNAAATAATLDLPINNNLGFAYIVPYNDRKQNKVVAQFQLGYKGFIQLAQRSGQFQRIGTTPIREGQIKSANPLTGYEFDFTPQEVGPVIGYAAYFKLINGFEATLYMTLDEVKQHGKKYSKTFNVGVWQTDFDAMASKTVVKLLLSKYAPLSIEMQTAIRTDQAVINDETATEVTYIDANDELDKVKERLLLMINDATTIDQLMDLQVPVDELNDEEVNAVYAQRKGEF